MGKKGTKKHPGRWKGCRTLELREALFRWAEGEAVFFPQELDRLPSLAEWANIAELHGRREAAFHAGFFVDPAERKALRSANVGAFCVDSARTIAIEKGTRARSVGQLELEEGSVMNAYLVGFDLENRKIVHTTRAAAPLAAKALAVKNHESSYDAIDVVVQHDDTVGGIGAIGGFGFRASGQGPLSTRSACP